MKVICISNNHEPESSEYKHWTTGGIYEVHTDEFEYITITTNKDYKLSKTFVDLLDISFEPLRDHNLNGLIRTSDNLTI